MTLHRKRTSTGIPVLTPSGLPAYFDDGPNASADAPLYTQADLDKAVAAARAEGQALGAASAQAGADRAIAAARVEGERLGLASARVPSSGAQPTSTVPKALVHIDSAALYHKFGHGAGQTPDREIAGETGLNRPDLYKKFSSR